VQPYSAPVHRSRESLVEALRANLGSEANASTKFQQTLALEPYPSPAYRLLYLGDGDGFDVDKIFVSPKDFATSRGLEPLRRFGVKYVVLKQTNVPNPSLGPLEEALRREARRIAEFTPYRSTAGPAERAAVPPFMHNTAATIHPVLERPGPIIEVWELGGPNLPRADPGWPDGRRRVK
jgi:hypothetical protein